MLREEVIVFNDKAGSFVCVICSIERNRKVAIIKTVPCDPVIMILKMLWIDEYTVVLYSDKGIVVYPDIRYAIQKP